MRILIFPTLLSLALTVTYVAPATCAPTSTSTSASQSYAMPSFSPVPGTTSTCDTNATYGWSYYVGPQKQSVLQAACTGLLTKSNGTFVPTKQVVSANIE